MKMNVAVALWFGLPKIIFDAALPFEFLDKAF